MTRFTLDVLAGPGGFGDGMHPTTASMMDVLQELAEEGGFERVLDMGCGSGLLSMAACCLWPDCRVLAVDVQQSAVETARHNAEKNDLAERITVVQADGYRHKQVMPHAPFDLVLANMTADVHASLAAQLPLVLGDAALVLLSGVLRWREEDIIALHEQHGLELIAEPIREETGWSTLLLAKSADA